MEDEKIPPHSSESGLPLNGNTVNTQNQSYKRYNFTDLQIEAAKLRAQGLSLTQIADRLGRKPNHISQSLKEFRSCAIHMRRAVQELSKVGYWEKQVDHAPLSMEALRIEEQMLQSGLWIFNKVPYGYVKEEGRLKVNPQEAEIVRTIYQISASGESPYKFGSKSRPGSPTKIYRMIRSPIYKGHIRFRGKIFPGQHEAIVDEETWEKAQLFFSGKKGPPPYGYKRVGLSLLPLDEQREIVRQVFRLRLDRRGTTEIAKTLGINSGLVMDILKRPLYKDKQWIMMGKPVKVEGGPFVEEKMWDAVQYIRISAKEVAQRRSNQTENKILTYLSHRRYATIQQISKATGLSYGHVKIVMRMLKWKGKVNVERQGARLLSSTLKQTTEAQPSQLEILEQISLLGKRDFLNRIFKSLKEEPSTSGQLRDKTGIHKTTTITKWLKTLETKGIVKREPSHKLGKWHIEDNWKKTVEYFKA